MAKVVDGYEDRKTTTRLNGVDAVSFAVRKQAGGNTVAITDRINAVLAKNAGAFPDLTIKPIHEDARFIRSNLEDVRLNIIFGGVMAVLIVFVFMRDWRSTLITALALPTSVIATFFFMWAAGFTLNMMTLMAISLVIGILIDDAVVVRENIYRHMEQGEDPMTAARKGTAEIGLAVMATTFTILAVFLPVGFMSGLVGQFFKSFALTVAFAVAMSLVIAFTLDPMLSSRFVRYVPPEERVRTRMGRVLERWGHFYDRLDRQYFKVLRWALAHPFKVVAAALTVFVASLSTLSVIGTEFVPNEDRGEFVVMVELPPGISFDETVKSVSEVERVLLDTKEVRQVFTTVGTGGQMRKSQLRVLTTRKDERSIKLEDLKADLRTRLKAIPFAEIKVADPEFIQGAPYEPPINVYVRGNDMKELKRLSDELVAKIRAIPGAVDVGTTLVSGQPELVAHVDRARAADLGFSVGSVATEVRSMVEGLVPSKLREEDHEFDIRVRLAPEFRNDFIALAAAPIHAHGGAVVRTGDLVRMEPGVGPELDRSRAARAAGQNRCRPAGTRPWRRHRRRPESTGRELDPGHLPGGLCRRRGTDAGVGAGPDAGDAAGRHVHLHRARLAVRVVHGARDHHAGAPARAGGRAAHAARHRPSPRHARDDRHRDADGARDEERHSSGRSHEPVASPEGPRCHRSHPGSGPGPATADSHDDHGNGAGHVAVGVRTGRRRRIPGADVAGDDWRFDDIHTADAGRGAGRVPVARSPARAPPSLAQGADAHDG